MGTAQGQILKAFLCRIVATEKHLSDFCGGSRIFWKDTILLTRPQFPWLPPAVTERGRDTKAGLFLQDGGLLCWVTLAGGNPISFTDFFCFRTTCSLRLFHSPFLGSLPYLHLSAGSPASPGFLLTCLHRHFFSLTCCSSSCVLESAFHGTLANPPGHRQTLCKLERAPYPTALVHISPQTLGLARR